MEDNNNNKQSNVFGNVVAGAGVLGGIGSNILSNISNNSLAQQQMDFQRQERLEAQEWNRQMWYEQQRYNSPLNQAERLKQAGINPTAVMDGDAASTTGQIASSTPQSGSSGHPNIPIFNSESLVNGLNSMMDLSLKREDLQEKQINNETRGAMNLAMLSQAHADLEYKINNKDTPTWQRKSLEKQLELNEWLIQQERFKTFRQGVQASHDDMLFSQTYQQMSANINKTWQESVALSIANSLQQEFGRKINNAQLNSIYTSIKEANSRIKLNGTLEKHELEKLAKTILEQANVRQSTNNLYRVQERLKQEINMNEFSYQSKLRYQADREKLENMPIIGRFNKSMYGLMDALSFYGSSILAPLTSLAK